jgi:hypothetical protein
MQINRLERELEVFRTTMLIAAGMVLQISIRRTPRKMGLILMEITGTPMFGSIIRLIIGEGMSRCIIIIRRGITGVILTIRSKLRLDNKTSSFAISPGDRVRCLPQRGS